jgi:hypothetical protein
VVVALEPGAFDCVLRFTDASEIEVTAPDGEVWGDALPGPVLPPIRILHKVVLSETEDPGRLQHTTTVFDVVTSAPPNSLTARVLREQKGTMVGQQLIESVARDGTPLATLTEPRVPEGLLAELSLQDRLLASRVLFPTEPMGIGARWRVTGHERRLGGLELSADSTYTLREHTPERVTVDVTTEMTVLGGADELFLAEAGPLDLPLENDASLSLHAQGSFTVWLSSLVVEGQETNTVTVSMLLKGPDGTSIPIESTSVFTFEMSARDVSVR